MSETNTVSPSTSVVPVVSNPNISRLKTTVGMFELVSKGGKQEVQPLALIHSANDKDFVESVRNQINTSLGRLVSTVRFLLSLPDTMSWKELRSDSGKDLTHKGTFKVVGEKGVIASTRNHVDNYMRACYILSDMETGDKSKKLLNMARRYQEEWFAYTLLQGTLKDNDAISNVTARKENRVKSLRSIGITDDKGALLPVFAGTGKLEEARPIKQIEPPKEDASPSA